ncbi:hypothetical protein HYH02_003565 [Chlamydomonas schloesseri]|uniref:Fe2OG dioxygenase domain-containing protein n=1 Tax=Chlamydomonas schloesseri TaxID=2026947 RepID=A0A835WQT6_9CHLO|nr:hypothetical protein HYH02_003565 [Chlamydomonas schloesseri]|eukprot:KAG2451787.1 hypothetical protein HYH02_003565 [Chlamydomonas schloesseri]
MVQMTIQVAGAFSGSLRWGGGSSSAATAGCCVQHTSPLAAACRSGWTAARTFASHGMNHNITRGAGSLVCAEASTSGASASASSRAQRPRPRRQGTGGGSGQQARARASTPCAGATAPSSSSSSSSFAASASGSVAPTAAASASAAGVNADSLVFIGFHPEEMDIIRQQLPAVAPVAAAGAQQPGEVGMLSLVGVTEAMLDLTLREALTSSGSSSGASGDGNGGEQGDQRPSNGAVAAGRVVLLRGGGAQELGGELNDLLTEWGVVPALVAAATARHESMPLRQVVAALRDAHARYYELLQPVKLRDSSSSNAATAGPAAGQQQQQQQQLDPADAAVLADVRVLLSAALDAGEVPSIHGDYRRDAAHVAVLDGLVTEAERAELLAWLTAPGHNHAGPPPEDKWEMACVDRVGDNATWGLRPEVLAALRDDPPPPVVALQSRLAALYPEYTLCHMPAQQISDAPGGDDDTDTTLSCFVGNAVMHGDPCAWHVDADPTTVPPYSPWVHNFGYYHNRELGRPLFVTVLIYLNDTWPEDNHAETLFLDPETQLGLFVRPAPGRVVLMEQDMPHRISAPSRVAPGPRYSLVWKQVWVPREGQGQGQGQGGPRDPACADQERAAGFQSLCRPEWGEPVRIGSANRNAGIRAYQPPVQQ